MHNWFGLTPHRTDSFVNWNSSKEDAKKEAEQFRKWYDDIVAAGFKDELDGLLSAGYQEGYEEGRDY